MLQRSVWILAVVACSKSGGADGHAASPCVRLLTTAEVTALGAAPPAMRHGTSGDICSYQAARGMMAAAYNATFGTTLGRSTREDVQPTGMWGREARSVTSLADACGFEAWAVDLQDARVLFFAHGEAGGSVGFPKRDYDEGALVEACKLIGPRLPALATTKIGSGA